jgi:hypothetical protein
VWRSPLAERVRQGCDVSEAYAREARAPLAGGAYTLYCDQGATGINYRVINNHFSNAFHAKVGTYGAATDCAGETSSGNVIHETGQAISQG